MASGSKSNIIEDGEEEAREAANRFWSDFESTDHSSQATPEADLSPSTGPATPEQATPETEPPARLDRGDGRDALGRFAPKGETATEKQEPTAKAGEAASAQAPEGEAKAPVEPPPGEAPAVDPTQAQTEPQPYFVRFDGRDIPVVGAVLTDTHLVIPKDSVPDVTKFLGMGLKLETERASLREEKARLLYDREMFQAETGPFLEEIKRQFEIAGGNYQSDEDFARAWLQYGLELRQSLPVLQKSVELSRREREIELRSRMQQPDPEVVQQQLAQQVQYTAGQYLSHWRSQPDFKGLTEEDWRWVEQQVQSDPSLFAYRVGNHPTEEEVARGAKPGEVVFNADRLWWVVQQRRTYRTDLAKAVAQAAKVAKQNAARAQAEQAPPPPAAQPARGVPNRVPGSVQDFKDRTDWDRWIEGED